MWKCTACDMTFVSVWIIFIAQVCGQANEMAEVSSTQHWNPNTVVYVTTNLECSRPDVYICETPPDVSPDVLFSSKVCNYRNVDYIEQIYRWVAGRGCLLYTPDFLFVNGTNDFDLGSACLHGTLFAPCLEIVKPDGTCGCFPFDPSFPEMVNAVQEAIISSAHGRWERCYQEAAACCSEVMSEEDVIPEPGMCGPTFDGWSCWGYTQSDTVASQVCSEFAYTNTGPTCHHFSYKNCTENATWEIQTEYGTCSITPRLVRRNRFYIWALAVSIIACVPAIAVFFFYRRLRMTRVALHRNLLIAIVIRNMLVIITRNEIYLDELLNASDTVMSAHEWPCLLLAVLERISVNVVFVCMLVEGIYLHRLICAVFRKELNVKMLYGVGLAIALIPVAVWATIMALLNDHSCWLVYTVPNVQWSLDGPRIAILVANTCLFLDILRVLLTKIRNSENTNQLSTAKATLFLMPLFGVQFLLTAYRPNSTSCSIEQTYYIFTYSMEALQGIVVAILYCYANKEVHNLMRMTYKKTETAVVSRVFGDQIDRRSTIGNSNRRDTYSTGLDSSPITHSDLINTLKLQSNSPVVTLPGISEYDAENGEDNEAFDSEEGSDSGYVPPENNEETESKASTKKADDIVETNDYINRPSSSTYEHGYIPPENNEDTESKTSTKKTDDTVEMQDWIKCTSTPSSSIYDNSLDEYEIRYLEQKTNLDDKNPVEQNDKLEGLILADDLSRDDISFSEFAIPDASELNGNELFEQIMQSEQPPKQFEDVKLNSDALSPNRPKADKIVFID